MKLMHIAVVACLGASLVAPSYSQPAQGSGMGPGAGMGPGGGMGAGAGQRGKAAGYGWNKGNTTGWSLMTAEERTAHQVQMRSVTSYDECKSLQAEHHKTMEARAKEKGATLPMPRQNGCDVMKSRGFIK